VLFYFKVKITMENLIDRKPELMAPAGDWAMLRTAVNAGADAVYFGVDKLNMRVF
jgi:collagenase-like PrtC family protease